MALPEDFNKIYGSAATGGLTPIGDVNYAKGWEFVGSNPPTKNDFSYLQNLSDLKSQWLYSNKLQRTDPFGDIKSDGAAAVSIALANLGLVKGIAGGISWTKINGVTEIWGQASIPAGGTTITLPIAMPDTACTIIATDADASIGQGAVIVGSQISTTQIHLHALKQGASGFLVDAPAGLVFFTVKSKVTV